MKKILLLLLLIGCANPEPKITRKDALYQRGKQETLKRLKAPSTAIFHENEFNIFQMRDDKKSWRVKISYEAKNPRGILLKNNITYVLTELDNDSLQYTLGTVIN